LFGPFRGDEARAAEGRPGKEQGKDVKTEVEGDGTGRERERQGVRCLAPAAGLPARGESREPRLPGRREAAASGFPGSEPVRLPPPPSVRRLDRGGKSESSHNGR